MRTPPFLSVSALKQFESQPNKFYLERLCDDRVQKTPQEKSAAVGAYFDVCVKLHLIRNSLLVFGNEHSVRERILNTPWPQKDKESMSTNDLLLESVEPHNRIGEVFIVGKKLFDAYIRTMLYLDNVWYDVEIRKRFTLNVTINNVSYSVPLYGILDAALGVHGAVPVDLKTSGYNSGASPKPGYWCSFNEHGHKLGAHKNCMLDFANAPFENIDLDWATQGCVYGWCLGKKLFEPFMFEIHAIYFNKAREIKVCGYKGIISSEFQKHVALRFVNAWKCITGQSETPWTDERLLCEMYSRQEKPWG